MKQFFLFFIFISIIILFFPNQKVNSQPWLYDLSVKKSSKSNFFDIQKAFEDYWKPYNVKGGYYIDSKGDKHKAAGWKQFKRWEWYWKSRVDNVTGDFPIYSKIDALKKLETLKPKKSQVKSTLGNWLALGPSNVNSPDFGTGRINCLTFDPNSNSRFWVGAPGGGVWRTDDNGGGWTCLTDNNPVLGVSVIELHPGYNGTTNRTIFIATGDRDAMDNPSVGLLKSTDDGATWQETGFSAGPGEGMTIGGLKINPTNPDIMLVGASTGLYRSTDGGNTWTLKQSGSFTDMERKPGSTTIYYASTNGWNPKVYKTIDAGNTWTLVRTITGHFRCEIAVTDADPNYVYIITSENANDSGNIERSTNSGDTWTIMYDTSDPNLFGWRTDGADDGGQGFYDIAIAVSNTNRDYVYIGGVNSHFSTNGGTSFTGVTCWTSSSTYNRNGSAVIHADHHNAYFHPVTNRLYDVNDGGVHYTDNITLLNNSTWTDITRGLANGQIYGIGVSQLSADETVAGFQDNGTKLLASGTALWSDVKGGDGMHCDIDVTTDEVQYGTYVELQVDRTTNGWTSRGSIRNGGGADWAGPLEGDPYLPGVIYIGTDAVERYNGSWSDMSTSLNSTSYLLALDVHNDGTNLVIYTADNTNLWRSNTSGTSFVSVKNNLPSNMVKDIAIDYLNPTTTAWVALGGYDDNNVYMTTDNGATWTDISEGLPELPCNTIVQNRQNTIQNELYVGTDVGVYVKLGNAPWQLFGEGLPNVEVSDLEIYYDSNPANSRLRAATYGRGVWESDIYNPPALDAAISAVIEPSSEYCGLGDFTPTFTLANIGTTSLTTADISYSLDGGASVNQAWSGNLAQGESTNIIFPIESLSYGTHDIVVTVSNTNGATDDVSINDINQKTFEVWNNTLPYTQNFDDFTNGGNYSGYGGESVSLSECWINGDESGVDWSVNSGATGSSGTGPDTYGDHTSGSGKYLYTETSSVYSKRADVLTPTFDLTNYLGANISFWYHMLGTNMGILNVDLHYGGVWHNNITVSFNGVSATSLSGNQADEWREATADISVADGYDDVIVRLRAEPTASDYSGDMSIDDFTLDATIACTQPSTQASNFNATPDYDYIDISWSRGTGDNLIILAHEGAAVNSEPLYSISYSANTLFGLGDEIGAGNFVVYNGTGTFVRVTGLNQGTEYHFAIYEYNSIDNCYLTAGITGYSTTLTYPPLISAIIPDNFFADLGKQLTIKGSNFNGVSSVELGGISGSIFSNDGSTLTVDFPAGNYSDNNLVITNSGGNDNFTCTVNTRNTIPVGNGTDSHLTITSALEGLFAWWGTNSFDAEKTIDVYSGTYTETVTPNLNLSPTVANMLVIKAHTDETPVINASTNANGVNIGNLDYVKFEGFTVFGATEDNIYSEGDYNQISFNKCYGSITGSGIKLNSANNTSLTNNLLYNNYNYGIQITGSDNLTVKNNTISDNGHNLILETNIQLYYQDFETDRNNWTTTGGHWSFYNDAAYANSGTYSAMCERTQNIPDIFTYSNTINISGFDNIVISCWVEDDNPSVNLEADDFIKGEFRLDGGAWTEFFSVYDDLNTYTKFSSSPIIGSYSTIEFRFTGDLDNNEWWQLDDIEIRGDEAGASGTEGSALYVESGNSIILENNILVAKTGTDYLAMKTEFGTSILSNYNTYYKDAGNTNLVNYLGTYYIDFIDWPNEGLDDSEANPLFVISGTDFHLQSTFGSFQGGQWPPISAIGGVWNTDASDSPAIDAGNADDYFNEPLINGDVINIGCYGNTQQASKSGFNSGTEGLWTGAISSNWFVSGNWDDGNVPIENTDVVIPVVAQLPVINSEAVCNNLIINSGASITIDIVGNLKVNGILTNNSGISGLIINSTEIGDGSIIHNNSGINATVKRFLDAPVSSTQWHYLSSPITNAPVSLFSSDFYKYDETTDDWWSDANLYGNSGWLQPTGNLVPTTGYIFNSTEITKNFEGELNYSSSNYDVSVLYTEHSGDAANVEPYSNFDGWNLVGNPYPTKLDWDAIIKTNVDATIYYYNDLTHNYAYYIENVGSVNGGSRYIPSMQGFFVKASTNTGGNLSITLLARENSDNSYFKNSDKNLTYNVLKLSVLDKDFKDELIIKLTDNASLLFDNQLDAYKRFSWDDEIPQIFSLNAEKNSSYSINCLPLSENKLIIPIGFKFRSEGKFILNIEELNFDGFHVFIEDIFDKISYNLNEINQIKIDYNDDSKIDRYQLNISKNNAPEVMSEIPNQEIELGGDFEYSIAENTFFDADLNDKLSFKAVLSNGNSLPKWLSFDAKSISFKGVPDVEQTIEIMIIAEDLLKAAVSSNFKINVSSATVIEIPENEKSSLCKIYPNPNNGIFYIEVDSKFNLIHYEITSISGKLIKSMDLINKGTNNVDMKGIANGSYILNIILDNNIKIKKSIIIEY